MKTHLVRAVLAAALLLCGATAEAQYTPRRSYQGLEQGETLFGINYEISGPLGDFKNYISNWSFRGFSGEGRYMVMDRLSLGASFSWNRWEQTNTNASFNINQGNVSGVITDLAIGDKVVSIPPYHVELHNVHQGCFTPAMQRFESWCLLLDVSGATEFDELRRRPLFCCAPLPLNKEVLAAFERVGRMCVRHAAGSGHYALPGAIYHPARSGSAQTAATMRVKVALLDLFALLIDVLQTDRLSPQHPPAVQQAIEFMSLHYRDPGLRLTDVSRAAHIGIDHFGLLFRRHMGTTPMRYLKELRVQQARYLLEHTRLLVEEVAGAVGFADPLHFSRVFRARTGKSPRAWRQAT